MLTATVVGNVWSTRRLEEIPNGAFLEVEPEGGRGSSPSTCSAAGSENGSWSPRLGRRDLVRRPTRRRSTH